MLGYSQLRLEGILKSVPDNYTSLFSRGGKSVFPYGNITARQSVHVFTTINQVKIGRTSLNASVKSLVITGPYALFWD